MRHVQAGPMSSTLAPGVSVMEVVGSGVIWDARSAPINERTRLGLAIENAGCAVRARTRSSVAGSGVIAWSENHLSMISGSSL